MYIFKDDSYIAIQLFASDGVHMVIFALIWCKVWMMMMTQLNLNHSNWTFPLISTLVLVLNQIFVPYTLHFALVVRFLISFLENEKYSLLCSVCKLTISFQFFFLSFITKHKWRSLIFTQDWELISLLYALFPTLFFLLQEKFKL